MAETSIKISLELADKAAQNALSNFIQKTDEAGKSLKKTGDAGKSTFNEISVGIGKSIGVFDIFAGNLAANVVVESFQLMTAAANSLFQTFIVDGIKAAQEQENSLNALNVSLAQSGQYSKETSQEFEAFANQLQATTKFQDDAILQNAALIESLASLDKDGLKRATQAAVDLSAALGKDLSTTSEALGKAANGNVTALQKMGLEFKKGQSDAETFANALKAIEDRFSGSAAAQVKTFSGAVDVTSHAFNDLQEEIGNIIIKNPAVIATVKELSKIFTELSAQTKSQDGAFKSLVGEGLSIFLKTAAFAVSMVDVVVRSFQILYGVVQSLSLPFIALSVPIRAMSVGLKQAMDEASQFGQQAANNLQAFGDKGDGALATVATDLLRLQDASEKGMNSLKEGADGTVEPLNRMTEATKALTEEQKRAQEQTKQFALELVKQSSDSKSSASQQLEVSKAWADSEIALQQDLFNQKLINEVEYQTSKADIEAQFAAAQQEVDLQKFNDDNARLIDARQQNLVSEQEFQLAKSQLADKFSADSAKRDATNTQREIANKKSVKDAEDKIQQQRFTLASDFFGNISSLMQTKSKELFEIGKAAAVAQAFIDSQAAIVKTMASVPYPFNIPLAAAQGLAGAVRIANIVSTQPSFEDGGIVPGTSFRGDNIQANVNSGEMILNRQQQSSLFSQINSGSGLSIDYERLASAVARALGAQPVIVNVGGRTIVDTLRDEFNSGRSLT